MEICFMVIDQVAALLDVKPHACLRILSRLCQVCGLGGVNIKPNKDPKVDAAFPSSAIPCDLQEHIAEQSV